MLRGFSGLKSGNKSKNLIFDIVVFKKGSAGDGLVNFKIPVVRTFTHAQY